MDEENEKTYEETQKTIIIQGLLIYSLSDENGQETATGEAQAQLDEANLSILPKFGEALLLPLRDISQITQADYKINVTLTSREKLVLSNLGYRYEDFFRMMFNLRNEILLKDMLMNETVVKSGVEAEFVYLDESGKEKQKGKCEPRLYETAMVVITDKGELFRIPYSDILKVREESYKLAVDTEYGDSFAFSKFGKEFDSWKKTLADSLNALTLKIQSSLKELLPNSDPSVIRRVARFMKEGKAARRIDVETVSPELWVELEKKLEVVGIKDEYDFLISIAQGNKMCIGLKRGLMGDLTGEYIWFLAPICSLNPKEPGNAIAMEATTGEGGGKATYFFRIASRADYANFENMEDLLKEVDRAIQKINRCMLAINFRREPIYLSDAQLGESSYLKYQFAIQKIPALSELRQIFIGRVVHSSPEQWQQDIKDLLSFNVNSTGDTRWPVSKK